MKNKLSILLFLLYLAPFLLTSCSKFKPVSARDTPTNALERAKKNVQEGKGVSLGGVLNRDKNTTYEFSTSNPMWRASLEVLDFLPLTTVDYSGGIIITDWYSDSNSKNNEALKITIRFLNNEIQTNSIKIIIHQKICNQQNICSVLERDSKIKEELLKAILEKATRIQTAQKK